MYKFKKIEKDGTTTYIISVDGTDVTVTKEVYDFLYHEKKTSAIVHAAMASVPQQTIASATAIVATVATSRKDIGSFPTIRSLVTSSNMKPPPCMKAHPALRTWPPTEFC